MFRKPAMNLTTVAKRLELLEETLIYRFLDRVQYAFHPRLYLYPKASAKERLRSSLLGLRLQAHEAVDLRFGRYSVAEEFPFSPFTTEAIYAGADQTEFIDARPQASSPNILQKLFGNSQNALKGMVDRMEAALPLSLPRVREISQCVEIMQAYLEFLVKYCPSKRDWDYGSALEHDVMVLQAISRRVHYGSIYVAEIKYSEQEAKLQPLIHACQRIRGNVAAAASQDIAAELEVLEQQILQAITRPEVEERILERVFNKAQTIQNAVQKPKKGQHLAGGAELQRHYLEPQALRDFYANCVIPLTKQGELAYLYRRA